MQPSTFQEMRKWSKYDTLDSIWILPKGAQLLNCNLSEVIFRWMFEDGSINVERVTQPSIRSVSSLKQAASHDLIDWIKLLRDVIKKKRNYKH